jgi:hypothetical protein
MDVMRVHQQEVTAEPAQSASEQSPHAGVVTQWLTLVLSIEERQYVIIIH